MKRLQPAEKGRNVRQTLLRCTPEDRMFPRIRNLKRFLRSQPDQSIVKGQPVFGKHADVDVDADSCPGHADGVCAVLQNVRTCLLFFLSRQREGAAFIFFRAGYRLPLGKNKVRVDWVWMVD